MKSLFAKCSLFALLLLLPSCFVARGSINAPLSADALKHLVPGKSTATDVVKRLGAPSQVVRLTKGSAYLYTHTIQKTGALILLVVNMGNSDERSDRIWAFFDEDDKLTHIGATLHADNAEYGLPWSNLHEEKIGEESKEVGK